MGMKMTMHKGEISLDGFCRRKGFYGKCGVRECDGVRFLRSYDTKNYAAECGGIIVTLSPYWSATSGSHLAAFAAFCGVDWKGKKSWENAPCLNAGYTLGMNESQIAAAVRIRVHGEHGTSAA